MRILLINPNGSPGVTRRIEAAARSMSLPGDQFQAVDVPNAPPLIVTEADQQRAADGVATVALERGWDADGIVIGSFGDTGIELVREKCPTKPVAGIGGAALAVASALAERFSIVSFSPSLVPSFEVMLARKKMIDRLDRIVVLENVDLSEPEQIQDNHIEGFADLCSEIAVNAPRSAVIFGGGPLAGLAKRLAPKISVPLIDGTCAAIGLMRSLSLARGAR
jgi:allantoin racemase